MRIPLAFGRLLHQLEPTAGSIGNGKLHAYSIKRRLTSSFELKNSFFIGSAMRETAIRGYSDVDLFTVFPRHVLKWGDGWISSDTLVRNVRNDLNERYPATEVRRDAQAIVVQFGRGSEPVDVVPAVFHAFKTEHRVPIFLSLMVMAAGWKQRRLPITTISRPRMLKVVANCVRRFNS